MKIPRTHGEWRIRRVRKIVAWCAITRDAVAARMGMPAKWLRIQPRKPKIKSRGD